MKDFFSTYKKQKINKKKSNEQEDDEDEFEDVISDEKNNIKNYIKDTIFNENIVTNKESIKKWSKKKSYYFDIFDFKDDIKKKKINNITNQSKYNDIIGINLTNYLSVPDEIRHKYTKPFLFQISKRLLVMKQPWRLPKNMELQTNNINHVSNYIKVLDRISSQYLNDPCINYYYKGLEIYNKNVFANIDYLLKKVDIQNIFNQNKYIYDNIIKINETYYDLNTFGKSPNNIFYQSFIIWDIHGNNLTLSEEYDKDFNFQILDYSYGDKDYPNLKFLINICSSIIFWLNFNKDNFAIINFHKANSFILLIFCCIMLCIEPFLNFDQLQEILFKASKIDNYNDLIYSRSSSNINKNISNSKQINYSNDSINKNIFDLNINSNYFKIKKKKKKKKKMI